MRPERIFRTIGRKRRANTMIENDAKRSSPDRRLDRASQGWYCWVVKNRAPYRFGALRDLREGTRR